MNRTLILLAAFAASQTLALFTALAGGDQPNQNGRTPQSPAAVNRSEQGAWRTLISVKELREKSNNPKLLVIDARSQKEYEVEHIPGAINIPGTEWRTPATKVPSKEGVGQKIFRTAEGKLDVVRYEALLSRAGVSPEHEIVVYGNHAGKADGSVAAAILLKLGHKSVAFLDGLGLDQWKSAEFETSKESRRLAQSRYKAPNPDENRLWSYHDVLKHLGDEEVVIIDSRTPEEFAGDDLRGNKRGGHIPGAKLLNSEDFLAKDKKTIDYEAAKAKIESIIPRGKTVVIYCQTGTRCTHKELLLKDLGYENVVLYDASWQEWANLDDTPVEANPKDAEQSQDAAEKTPAKDSGETRK